jgi:hypothetical protein
MEQVGSQKYPVAGGLSKLQACNKPVALLLGQLALLVLPRRAFPAALPCQSKESAKARMPMATSAVSRTAAHDLKKLLLLEHRASLAAPMGYGTSPNG